MLVSVKVSALHRIVIVLAYKRRNSSQTGLDLICSQGSTDNPIYLSWFGKKGLANDIRGMANPPPWQMSKLLVNNRTGVKRNKWLVPSAGRLKAFEDLPGKDVEVWLEPEMVNTGAYLSCKGRMSPSMRRWRWAIHPRSVQSLKLLFFFLSLCRYYYTIYVHLLYVPTFKYLY